MSLNQIIYKNPGDTIDDTLNLKANSIQVKSNINVPFINGTPYVGGSVNVGTARQLLQTDAAGITPEWTSDIKINNAEIDQQISLAGNTGLNNQVIVKSGGVPTWGTPTISLPSIPTGPIDSVLITNSSSDVAWSKNLNVDNVDIDQQLSFNGDSGSNGEIIIKSAGIPTWGTPTFTLPSIPIGTSNQLLQTNAGATSAEWTSNIKVADTNITGNLQMNGSSGSTGNALIKSGASQVWGKMNVSNLNPGLPRTILNTNSDSTGVEWTNSIRVQDADFTGDIKLNGNSGVTKQYIKKNGSTQIWSNIASSDITPGGAYNTLITNASGSTAQWGYVTENYIKPTPATFSPNQVLTIDGAGTGSTWDLVQTDSIQPGGANQVLTTNGLGTVTWTNLTSPITPGSPYQVLQTNAAGTGAEWTSQFRGTSILFNSPAQSILNKYYVNTVDLPIYVVSPNSIPTYLQPALARATYVIIGKSISMTINTFTIPTPTGAPINNNYYVALLLSDTQLTPAVVNTNPSGSSLMQTSSSAIVRSGFSNPNDFGSINNGFANVYHNYYNSGLPFIEFTRAANPTSYNSTSDHGQTFPYNSGTAGYFMQLLYPITINYILQ